MELGDGVFQDVALGLAEGWRVPKKEFAGLDCEGGLLASPDGVGGVLGWDYLV